MNTNSPIAQLVVQLTCNEQVVGSSPTRRSRAVILDKYKSQINPESRRSNNQSKLHKRVDGLVKSEGLVLNRVSNQYVEEQHIPRGAL
jgi:hypothetical protein